MYRRTLRKYKHDDQHDTDERDFGFKKEYVHVGHEHGPEDHVS